VKVRLDITSSTVGSHSIFCVAVTGLTGFTESEGSIISSSILSLLCLQQSGSHIVVVELYPLSLC